MAAARRPSAAERPPELNGPQAKFLAWAERQGLATAPTRRLEPGETPPPGFRAFPDSLRERGQPVLCQPVVATHWVQSRSLGGRFNPSEPRWRGLLRFLERKLGDVVALELDAAGDTILRLLRPRRTFEQHCDTLYWLMEDRVISAMDALASIKPAQVDRFVAPRLSARRRRQAPLLKRGQAIHPGLAVGALGHEILLLERPGLKDLPRLRSCQGAIVREPGRAAFWLQHFRIPSLEVDSLEGLQVGSLATLERDRLFAGALPAWIAQGLPPGLECILDWADNLSEVRAMASVDHPEEADLALEFGARGIGLCRVERLLGMDLVREVILRKKSPDELASVLLERLRELFRVVRNRPAVIRLMDQVLPGSPEVNPRLGMRGARLAQVAPDLYRAQVRAIAALAAERKTRITILVPNLSDPAELALFQSWLREPDMPRLRLGAMLETPRACLSAGSLAEHASVLSVDGNDLTALVFGLSREDAPLELLPLYLERRLYAANPFRELDPVGVVPLIEQAVEAVRRTRPRARLGICGEQARHPGSAAIADRLKLDFLSVEPLHIPGLRLALAQAWMDRNRKK